MKKGKWFWAALALTVVTASACSSGSEGTNEPANPATDTKGGTPAPEQPAEAALPEEATIRILTENSTAWPAKEDWGVWKWVKEETNITVKQELITGPESLALAISSGDMPDIMSVFPAEVQKYGPQGAFEDLSKHMDKMPNVKAFLEAHPLVKQRVVSPTGEIYSILNDGAGEGSQMVWFYRDDIFAKHNLQVPKTWDELYTVSKQLKELYPDSYPFTFRHGLNTLSTFGPTFGIYPQVFQDPVDQTKIKFGFEEPAAKTMVETLNKFMAEKLIPPDWLTMDYKAWTQFMSNNQAFITVQFIGQIEIMNNQLPEGQHLSFMPPPIGLGDKPYLPRGGYENFGLAVASTSPNKDAAFRYLDYIFSEKGRDIQSWGKEGETYTIVDGKRKFNDNYKEANDLRVVSGIMTAATYGWFDFNATLSLVKDSEQAAYVEAPKYRFPVGEILPALTPEEAEAVAPLNDQIWKFWQGEVAKFIYGERPMSEWESFVADLSKNGLNEIKTTYQKALDRQYEIMK